MVVRLVVRSHRVVGDSHSVSKVDGRGTRRQEQEQPEIVL